MNGLIFQNLHKKIWKNLVILLMGHMIGPIDTGGIWMGHQNQTWVPNFLNYKYWQNRTKNWTFLKKTTFLNVFIKNLKNIRVGEKTKTKEPFLDMFLNMIFQ